MKLIITEFRTSKWQDWMYYNAKKISSSKNYFLRLKSFYNIRFATYQLVVYYNFIRNYYFPCNCLKKKKSNLKTKLQSIHLVLCFLCLYDLFRNIQSICSQQNQRRNTNQNMDKYKTSKT